jgi:hypothetical protein
LQIKRLKLAEQCMIVLAKRKARQGYRERDAFLNTAAVALLSERIPKDADSAGTTFGTRTGPSLAR